MTVYVDDIRIRTAVGGVEGVWSHLTADTREELHEFAIEKLGLRREWFQDPVVNGKPKAKLGSSQAKMWHYDITESKRRLAVRLGAVEVSWRDMPYLMTNTEGRD